VVVAAAAEQIIDQLIESRTLGTSPPRRLGHVSNGRGVHA